MKQPAPERIGSLPLPNEAQVLEAVLLALGENGEAPRLYKSTFAQYKDEFDACVRLDRAAYLGVQPNPWPPTRAELRAPSTRLWDEGTEGTKLPRVVIAGRNSPDSLPTFPRARWSPGLRRIVDNWARRLCQRTGASREWFWDVAEDALHGWAIGWPKTSWPVVVTFRYPEVYPHESETANAKQAQMEADTDRPFCVEEIAKHRYTELLEPLRRQLQKYATEAPSKAHRYQHTRGERIARDKLARDAKWFVEHYVNNKSYELIAAEESCYAETVRQACEKIRRILLRTAKL